MSTQNADSPSKAAPAASLWARAIRRTRGLMARWLTVLVVLGSVVLAAGVLLTAGAPWLLRTAAAHSDGRLTVAKVRGGFLRELQIGTLQWRGEGMDLRVRDAVLRWQPAALWGGMLWVDALRAQRVDIRLKPSPPKPIAPLPLAPPLGLVLLRAQAAIDHLTVQPDKGEAIALHQVAATLRWTPSGIRVADATVQHPSLGGLRADGDAVLAAFGLRAIQLTLQGPAEERIQLSGEVFWDAHPSALQIDAQQLQWPRVGAAQWRLPQLVAQLTGPLPVQTTTPTALQLMASGQLQAPGAGLPAGKVAAEGVRFDAKAQLKGARLDIAQLQLWPAAKAPTTNTAAPLAVQGWVDWQAELQAQAKATLTDFDPSWLLPEWPGAIHGTVQLQQSAPSAPVLLSAQLRDSRLRGRPLQLAAKAQFQALRGQSVAVKVDTLRVQSGTAVLQAAGGLLPKADAQLSLTAPALADLAPDLSGSGKLSAQMRGVGLQWQAKADARVQGLQYRAAAGSLIKLGSGDIRARLSPGAVARWDAHRLAIDATATNLAYGAQTLQSLRVSASGALAQHQAQIAVTGAIAQGRRAQLDAQVRGGWQQQTATWRGQVQQFTVDSEGLPPLVLVAPTALALSAQQQSLQNACWRANAATLCLAGQRSAKAESATVRIERLPLAQLMPLVPEPTRSALRTTLIANGHAEWQRGDPRRPLLQAELALGAGTLQWQDRPALSLQSATLALQSQASQWQLRSAVQSNLGSVQGEAQVPVAGEVWTAKPVSARLQIDIPTLAPVLALLPDVGQLAGKLAGELRASGTLGAPVIAGEVQLTEGRYRYPALGLDLKALTATVRRAADDPAQLAVQGSASAGEGSLQLDGSIALAASPTVALRISGDNARLVNMPDARVWASPQLELRYDDNGAVLTGAVHIPKAEITPRQLSGGAVGASSDVVIAGQAPAAARTPLRADIDLSLGDKVRFEGFGLKAQLGGGLRITEAPGLASARGRGALLVKGGSFEAYGRSLVLKSGRLLYNGAPLTEPVLDVTAERRISEDISVQLLLRGTPAELRLDFASTPPMTREEQISWLVLGRPLSSTNDRERQVVGDTALALGLGGGQAAARWLGEALGLDDVTLGAPAGQATQSAALTVGKYLSPRLYVSYAVGLFDRSQVLRVLYDLGRGFSVRTEAGLEAGADLLYTRER